MRRSARVHRSSLASLSRRLSSLWDRAALAGQPRGVRHNSAPEQVFEALEQRTLLAGDHPSFNQVFNTLSPLTPTAIVLNPQGSGTSNGLISPAGDNDVFQFTAPDNDFVRVWADTLNPGSSLDSRVEVYTGTVGGSATLLTAGSNNGTLTSGVFTDGWTSFFATAGTTYFVVIRSDRLSGGGSTGNYTVRVDTRTTAFPALDPTSGVGQTNGNISLRGGDQVFRLTTGTGAAFDSLATLVATSPAVGNPALPQLDTRIDIYRADGRPLTLPGGVPIADSDSGWLSNAFTTMKVVPNTTYFIRVRSDRLGVAPEPSTGPFTLKVDAIASPIAMQTVTRQGQIASQGVPQVWDSVMNSFIAQGSGLTIITVIGVGLNQLPDSAIRLYDNNGVFIGFNARPDNAARLEIQLLGGERYYPVVENFDGGAGGDFRIEVESNHTFTNNIPALRVDDHVNTPEGTLSPIETARRLENATPIVWSDPVDAPVPLNPIVPGPFPSPLTPLPAITDHWRVVLGTASGRLYQAGDTDLFQFVPPADMLSDFDGEQNPRPNNTIPPSWATGARPSSRLQIWSIGGTLNNTRIRVLDSNFNPIFTNARAFANLPDPAGSASPSVFPPNQQFGQFYGGLAYPVVGIPVWGGFTYYLEVAAEGGGEGRYNLQLQADAPSDSNGRYPVYSEVPSAGNFGSAKEILIDVATGEGQNYYNAAGATALLLDPNPNNPLYTLSPARGFGEGRGRAANFPAAIPPPPAAGVGAQLGFPGAPPAFTASTGNNGFMLLNVSDYGIISTVTDTNLYQFRALRDGTAEVRINTTQIQSEFAEIIQRWTLPTPVPMPPPIPPTPTPTRLTSDPLNSPLAAGLTIFNNDFQRIEQNLDGNTATSGASMTKTVGSLGTFTFQRRDPRVVFPVEAGKTYYILVESSQRRAFEQGGQVDWRSATGKYQLLVNSMSDLAFDDDHVNFTGVVGGNVPSVQSTPIPINLENPSTTAVLGSVIGEIRNTTANVKDSDVFFFDAPTGTQNDTALARINVRTREGDAFDRRVFIVDANGGIINSTIATGSNSAELTFGVAQGERFFVIITGDDDTGGISAPNQGRYIVELSGIPAKRNAIDQIQVRPGPTGEILPITTTVVPNAGDFARAAVIPSTIYDFTGFAQVNSRIFHPGDKAIFAVDALTYNRLNVEVESLSGVDFRPVVEVYEIGDDSVTGADGNPVLLRVGYDNALLNGVFSRAVSNVPLTAPDRTGTQTPPRVLNTYYIVVSGVDPNLDVGEFALRFSFNTNANVPFGTTDDHPDADQWVIASPITLVTNPFTLTGTGASTGIIEKTGDSDLFTFTSLGTGRITITLSSPASSVLPPRLRVFDSAFNPVTDLTTGQTIILGPDTQISAATLSFDGLRNQVYYILADAGPNAGNVFKTGTTGSYAISILTQIPDDHANAGEFNDATNILLSQFSGAGTSTGNLEVAADTDLFRTDTILAGNLRITLSVAPGSTFRPVLALFDPAEQQIGAPVVDGGAGDEDGVINGSVIRTISGTAAAARYWILVSSDQGQPVRTGSYSIIVQGPVPTVPGDDHPNAGEWDIATIIPLNPVDGGGNASGQILPPTDTDLFRFLSIGGTEASPRRGTVELTIPTGQALRVGVRIFGPDRQLITEDFIGGPGASARVNFNITATNQFYYILVLPVDPTLGFTGNYAVRVKAEPQTFTLYYPEGFTNRNIREYISFGNSNPFPVDYTVRLKYANTSLPDTIFTGTLAGNSRSGLTISDGPNGVAPGVRPNTAFAIVIESNAFISASISHYDFGSTFGEAFTSTTSTTWSFARLDKFPGGINDFLIYYNPNLTSARVTLTAYYPTGAPVVLTQIIQGQRRGGWTINAESALRLGQFSAVVTSEPLNPGDAHVGIVAALSHYNLIASPRNGYGMLGVPGGGTTSGVAPGLIQGDNANAEFTIFNNSGATANVTLTGKYINTTIPDLIRPLTIPAFSFITLTGADLGLVANQPIGIRYDSNTPVTVLAGTSQLNSVDTTHGNVELANSWFWGDAFINRRAAGTLYFETMYFYNPDPVNPLTVDLNFFYRQGTTSNASVLVPAGGFAQLNLHQLPQVINPYVFNFFSIEATSSGPFAAKLTHFDLVLNGGWGSRGAARGLTLPISSFS